MKIRLTKLEDKVSAKLQVMLDKADHPQGFINRVIYPMYQAAQIDRWQTENLSEGTKWKPLNPRYKQWKVKAYSTYPYAGRKMLIATGMLFKSVVGSEARYHRKLVTKDGLIVMTTVNYAQDVADVRPFMDFKQRSKTLQKMRTAYRDWVRG